MSKKYHQIKEPTRHTIVFGKQGSGKDLLIVGWLAQLQETGSQIYSNSVLKFPFSLIKSVQDIEQARNGALYLHDMDLLFNSRDFALKKNQNKQETLLELVNNMRKHGLSLYGSCHRSKSIDVKLRTLINYWIQPRMVLIGDDRTNLWDYNIIYDVYDEYGEFSHTARVRDLPKYADLYDTYDCVKQLSDTT